MAPKFFAIIAGAGPGTGRSLALRFAKHYHVVLIARNPSSHSGIVSQIQKAGGEATGIIADLGDAHSVATAFGTIKDEFPGAELAVAVFNAAGGFYIKPFLELKLEQLRESLTANVEGLFNFTQAAIPRLLAAVQSSQYPPTLIVTGATAAIRGSKGFSTFSAGRSGARALTQSLAREFGPQGVHVAHVVLDGMLDIPMTANWDPNPGKEDCKINTEAVAEAYWNLHRQHRSALTQELEIRPYAENF